MADRVLVAGADGNLGRRIVRALVERGGVDVVAGTRDGRSRPEWDRSGVSPTALDLANTASLRSALSGVRAIVSAVQGDREVIVDGQRRLLDAAQSAGVERLVPSDYSIDLFAIPEGVNPLFDLRREFDRALMASGMGWTLFLNGGFTEVVLGPQFGMIDPDRRTISYWGDGTVPLDLTTMDDAADFVAETVVDPATLRRVVKVAGDQITPVAIATAFERAHGTRITPVRLGSIEEGYQQLRTRREAGATPFETLSLIYGLPMMSGEARFTTLDNARYPEIVPTTVESFVRQGARQKAAAE